MIHETTTDLHPCFSWTCDNCGIRNVSSPPTATIKNVEGELGVSLDQGEFGRMKISGSADAATHGSMPEEVRCQRCGTVHRAVAP